MTERPITNHRQLLDRIQLLEEKEKFYRARITKDAAEIIETLKDPAPYFKRVVKNLAADSDFRADLFNAGLNHIGRFIFKKASASDKLPGWFAELLKKFRSDESR